MPVRSTISKQVNRNNPINFNLLANTKIVFVLSIADSQVFNNNFYDHSEQVEYTSTANDQDNEQN
jgi:hypothetical protein